MRQKVRLQAVQGISKSVNREICAWDKLEAWDVRRHAVLCCQPESPIQTGYSEAFKHVLGIKNLINSISERNLCLSRTPRSLVLGPRALLVATSFALNFT